MKEMFEVVYKDAGWKADMGDVAGGDEDEDGGECEVEVVRWSLMQEDSSCLYR